MIKIAISIDKKEIKGASKIDKANLSEIALAVYNLEKIKKQLLNIDIKPKK